MSLASFLGLKRNTTLLLITIIFASTGERLWLGFAPKYLEYMGGGILLIGIFDALQTLLSALYAYPGAWLTDRFGQRKSLLIFTILSLVGYILVLSWQSSYSLLIGTFFFVAWSALSLPTTFSVVATSLRQEKITMGIGVQSMVRRVPMIIGPLVGGFLISLYGWQDGIRYALVLCVLLCVIAFLLQYGMADDNASGAFTPQASFLKILKAFPTELKELLISDILIRFCERIPYAFVILWAINHHGITPKEFGVLTAIEMATAMLCYIPVAHLADKYGQRPFILATFVFFSLFPVALMFSSGFVLFAIVFSIRGLKEFGEPARKALIIKYSPAHLKSSAYGVYYLIRDCTVTAGSFLGAFLWSISPLANFLGAALCGIMGTAWFYFSIMRKK